MIWKYNMWLMKHANQEFYSVKYQTLEYQFMVFMHLFYILMHLIHSQYNGHC